VGLTNHFDRIMTEPRNEILYFGDATLLIFVLADLDQILVTPSLHVCVVVSRIASELLERRI
jgi:hypothetical protein